MGNHKYRNFNFVTIVAAVVILACVDVVSAVGDDVKADIDPQAREIISAVSATMKQANNFSMSMTASQMAVEGNVKSLATEKHKVAFERPSRLSIALVSGGRSSTIVCDGVSEVLYMPVLNQYIRKAYAEDMKEFFSASSQIGSTAKAVVPMIDIFCTGDWSVYLKEVIKVTYAGIKTVGSVQCHKLQFALPYKDMQFERVIYVQEGKEALIRRVTDDYSAILRSLMLEHPQLGKQESVPTWDFADWKIDTELPANAFKFTKPGGAKEVIYFKQEDNKPKHALLGKQAPDFKLQLLSDKKVSLSQHKGKEVVILDFWASRCGPCRVALPLLAEIAKQYRSKGVVFYAVNVEDKAESIRDFLKSVSLDVAVALGGGTGVNARYGVQYLPQTVVIDKSGKVQSVHVGFDQNAANQLRAELDAILAGNDLTVPQAAAPPYDLAVKEVTFSPLQPRVDDKVTVTYTLANKGDTLIPAGSYRLMLRLKNAHGYDMLGSVAIDKSGEVAISITEDVWHFNSLKAGAIKYDFAAVPLSMKQDKNMENNIVSGQLQVVEK